MKYSTCGSTQKLNKNGLRCLQFERLCQPADPSPSPKTLVAICSRVVECTLTQKPLRLLSSIASPPSITLPEEIANDKTGIFERKIRFKEKALLAKKEFLHRQIADLFESCWNYYQELQCLAKCDLDPAIKFEFHIISTIFKIVALFYAHNPCNTSESFLIKCFSTQALQTPKSEPTGLIQNLSDLGERLISFLSTPTHFDKTRSYLIPSLDILFLPPYLLLHTATADKHIMGKFGPLILREAILTGGLNTMQDVTSLSKQALLTLSCTEVDEDQIDFTLHLDPRHGDPSNKNFNVFFNVQASTDVLLRTRAFIFNVNYELKNRDNDVACIENARVAVALFRAFCINHIDDPNNLYEDFYELTNIDLEKVFRSLPESYHGNQRNWHLLPLIVELISLKGDHLNYILSEISDIYLLEIKIIIDRLLNEQNQINLELLEIPSGKGEPIKPGFTKSTLESLENSINATFRLRFKHIISSIDNFIIHAAKTLEIFESYTSQQHSSYPWTTRQPDMSGFKLLHKHLSRVEHAFFHSYCINYNKALMDCKLEEDLKNEDMNRFGKPLYPPISPEQRKEIEFSIRQFRRSIQELGNKFADELAHQTTNVHDHINLQSISQADLFGLKAFFATAPDERSLLYFFERVSASSVERYVDHLASFKTEVSNEIKRRNLPFKVPKMFPAGRIQANRKRREATREKLASVVSSQIRQHFPPQIQPTAPPTKEEKIKGKID